MYKIEYQNQIVECFEGETILNAFFRKRVNVPFSCRKGSCQVCILQVEDGQIPDVSQQGLKENLVRSGHFLPCQCVPVSDMRLKNPRQQDLFIDATITGLIQLSPMICQLEITLPEPVEFRTGQFANIKTKTLDEQSRSYSISSLGGNNRVFTVDVQRIKAGIFSSWVFEQAQSGDQLAVQMPLGECCHSHDLSLDAKLIAVSGSGLGVGLALAEEICQSSYQGVVRLCHYSRNEQGWYHQDKLAKMAEIYSNFEYLQTQGDDHVSIRNWLFNDAFKVNSELYMYGGKNMITMLTEKAQSSGMSVDALMSDSFDYKTFELNKNSARMDDMEFVEELPRRNTQDLAMWAGLGEGELLKDILEDFYTNVFQDDLLKPFFKGVTKNHVIGKQFAFLKQYYTGEDIYFGDRPRNAHHWMVISHELFDHREKLFRNSCVRCGLQEPFLSQLLMLNESYRKTIVKSRVWPRITDGVIEEIKGFDEIQLDVGGLCDGCHQEIEPLTVVRFHGQTGEMFCPQCSE